MKLEMIKYLLIVLFFTLTSCKKQEVKLEKKIVGEWKYKNPFFKHKTSVFIKKDTLNKYLLSEKDNVINLFLIKDTLYFDEKKDKEYYLIYEKKDTINIVIKGKIFNNQFYSKK